MEFNKDILHEKGSFILEEAEKLGASQAETRLFIYTRSLTRLANSIIDQNVSEKHFNINVSLYFGKKKGSVSVEVIDNESIKLAVANAAKIAKVSPENTEFISLPEPKAYSDRLKTGDLISKNTLNISPETRAEQAKLAVDTGHEVDKRIKAVAGSISNALFEKMVMNSLGIEAYEARTTSNAKFTVLGKDGSEETAGWSANCSRDFDELNVEKVVEKAARKAADGFGAKLIDPGEYEVILEPAAFGGFLPYFSMIGFSALAYQDHRSFLLDKIGEQVFSPELELVSDPLNKKHHVNATRFDHEGIPTRRTELVSSGVVKGLVYDTLTSSKDGVESTGHGYKYRGVSYPSATHLTIKDGDSSLEEMIAETKNGILVTHFHYQNVINPVKGVLTGLTRDGAWFVKNGEIVYPLKTLRYTDSVTRFLGNIDMLGKKSPFNDSIGYSMLGDANHDVPSMKLPAFRISSNSK